MARWDNAGFPHKGWTLIECIDLGADVSDDDEIEYERVSSKPDLRGCDGED